MASEEDLWEKADAEAGKAADGLVVDVDGFEGPLDLLLSLARSQKVDLAKISILQLAEQYLSFIDRVREMRLELAADYLVMAAWLAFLKSKLLLPDLTEDDEGTPEELAEILAFRLKRLEAMRNAANSLINRNRLGRDVFARGEPDPIVVVKTNEYSDTLYDLLTAYATQRQRQSVTLVTVKARTVWSLQDARDLLKRMIGKLPEWGRLDEYLITYIKDPEERVSALASSFSASLELVREGAAEIRQSEAYAPIYLKSKDSGNDSKSSE